MRKLMFEINFPDCDETLVFYTDNTYKTACNSISEWRIDSDNDLAYKHKGCEWIKWKGRDSQQALLACRIIDQISQYYLTQELL